MTIRNGATGEQQRPAQAIWTVSVAGERRGPMPLSELAGLVREGRVDDKSYAWRAGMPEWKRMGEIAELAVLFVDPPPLPTLGALKEGTEPAPAPTPALAPTPSPGWPDAAEASAGATDTANPQVPDELHAELAALSQEFSVVERIERSRKRRWVWVAGGLAAAGAIAAIVVLGPLRQEPLVDDVPASTHKPFDKELRRETPRVPAPGAHDEAAARQPENAASAAGSQPIDEAPAGAERVTANAPTATEGASTTPHKNPNANAPTGRKLDLVVPTLDSEGLEKSRERLATLSVDEVGKREAQIVFDPAEASRRAVAADAAKDKASPEALSERVATAFGKKRTQFAKCSDARQERVKVVFTVEPNGRTANAEIDGTASDAKARCIRAILDRSLFPAGDKALTYSQTLVL